MPGKTSKVRLTVSALEASKIGMCLSKGLLEFRHHVRQSLKSESLIEEVGLFLQAADRTCVLHSEVHTHELWVMDNVAGEKNIMISWTSKEAFVFVVALKAMKKYHLPAANMLTRAEREGLGAAKLHRFSTLGASRLHCLQLCLQVLDLGPFLQDPDYSRGPISFFLQRPVEDNGGKVSKKKSALVLANKLHPVTHIVVANLNRCASSHDSYRMSLPILVIQPIIARKLMVFSLTSN
eukprot:scaffold212263_cov15-Tisochrysis_lutea.AAC.1